MKSQIVKIFKCNFTLLSLDDLPLNFHPLAIRASGSLLCSQTLDHLRPEFSASFASGGLDYAGLAFILDS